MGYQETEKQKGDHREIKRPRHFPQTFFPDGSSLVIDTAHPLRIFSTHSKKRPIPRPSVESRLWPDGKPQTQDAINQGINGAVNSSNQALEQADSPWRVVREIPDKGTHAHREVFYVERQEEKAVPNIMDVLGLRNNPQL